MSNRNIVLLKMSGEALGLFDHEVLLRVVAEIGKLIAADIGVAIVIGGGNLIRGAEFASEHIAPEIADYMGLKATEINGLALLTCFNHAKIPAKLLSACGTSAHIEEYEPERAQVHLRNGQVVILSGGTGKTGCTTDTAAVLRAKEIGATLLIKATKVDGVYDKDPKKFPDAKFLPTVTCTDALEKRLKIMDKQAFELFQTCPGLSMRIINMTRAGEILAAGLGENRGSLVTN